MSPKPRIRPVARGSSETFIPLFKKGDRFKFTPYQTIAKVVRVRSTTCRITFRWYGKTRFQTASIRDINDFFAAGNGVQLMIKIL